MSIQDEQSMIGLYHIPLIVSSFDTVIRFMDIHPLDGS